MQREEGETKQGQAPWEKMALVLLAMRSGTRETHSRGGTHRTGSAAGIMGAISDEKASKGRKTTSGMWNSISGRKGRVDGIAGCASKPTGIRP